MGRRLTAAVLLAEKLFPAPGQQFAQVIRREYEADARVMAKAGIRSD
jgi:hypothetical protein